MSRKAVIYPVSRLYYEKVIPSVKSVIANTAADDIILTAEDDELPTGLIQTDRVRIINAVPLKTQYIGEIGPNVSRTKYVYLCLLRLAYPLIFPEYDRVLALDADTIVRRNIGSEPWTLDLSRCQVGGVPETKISAQKGRPYINAGVMLMDLERMRNDKVADTMLKIAKAVPYQWLEQDIINAYCSIKPLEAEWNCCQFTQYIEEEDAKILHYAYTANWEQKPAVREYAERGWGE